MASLTHLAAGAVCGAVYARVTRTEPAHAIVAYSLVALAPDLDIVAAQLGARATPLDHRVMTHALPFAVGIGAAIGAVWKDRSRRLLVGVLTAAALASHGLLDALTSGSLGPQLLWPFSTAPVGFAWRPIPGAESFQQYFLLSGVPVLRSEALLSAPLLGLAGLILVWPTKSLNRPSAQDRWRWWPGRRTDQLESR